MNEIDRLARLSVLRASGFSGLAILMVMMGTAYDLAASFRFGATGLIVLSLAMAFCARHYHRRRRIQDTEVWLMLEPEERPAPDIARVAIIRAMKEQLTEKALWWAVLALVFVATSAVVMLTGAMAYPAGG